MELLDEMILELEDDCEHFQESSLFLDAILEKVSSLLVQVEANSLSGLESSGTDSLKAFYSYSKDSYMALAEIIKNFEKSSGLVRTVVPRNNPEKYIQNTRRHVEMLGSNIRKLSAIKDIVTRLSDEISKLQEEDFDDAEIAE